MPSSAQRANNARNSNRLRKAWKIARALSAYGVAQHPDLALAGDDFRLRLLRVSGVNPRALSDHTWRLSVAIARRISVNCEED
jgi:hypothetical protein